MIKVFNSTFENSLRLILLLNEFDSAQSLERLYTTDFLTVYANDFDVASENLNGDNDFKYSEFQSRKTVCRSALKELVLNGLVIPMKDRSGIRYQINDDGKQYADSLHSEYAVAYRENARSAIKYAEVYSDRQIITMINRMSTDSVRGGNHE